MRFLSHAVLRDGDGLGAGRHGALFRQGLQRSGGHVFKLGGDGGADIRQSANPVSSKYAVLMWWWLTKPAGLVGSASSTAVK